MYSMSASFLFLVGSIMLLTAFSDAPDAASGLKITKRIFVKTMASGPTSTHPNRGTWQPTPYSGGFFMGQLAQNMKPQLGRGTAAATEVERVTENWIGGKCEHNGELQCYRLVEKKNVVAPAQQPH